MTKVVVPKTQMGVVMEFNLIESVLHHSLVFIPQWITNKDEEEGPRQFVPMSGWNDEKVIEAQIKPRQKDPEFWKSAEAIALLTGPFSNHTVAFDFDIHMEDPALRAELTEQVNKCAQALLHINNRLYLEKTRSDGLHMVFRLKFNDIKAFYDSCKSVLAKYKEHNAVELLSGCQCYVYPSPGYTNLNGVMYDLPEVDEKEYNRFLNTIYQFFEKPKEKVPAPAPVSNSGNTLDPTQSEYKGSEDKWTIYDEFLAQGGLNQFLMKSGYTYSGCGRSSKKGPIQDFWLWPGSSSGSNRSIGIRGDIVCVYTTNLHLPNVKEKHIAKSGKLTAGYNVIEFCTYLHFGEICLDANKCVTKDYVSKFGEEIQGMGYSRSLENFPTAQPVIAPEILAAEPKNDEPKEITADDYTDCIKQPWLVDFREKLAAQVQVNRLTVDLTMLGVLSGLTCRVCTVDWISQQPTNMYIALGLPASQRKSTLLDAVVNPILDMDLESEREFKVNHAAYEVTLRGMNNRYNAITKSATMTAQRIQDAVQLARDIGEYKTQKPRKIQRILGSTFTLEAIVEKLINNKCLLMAQSEGSLFDLICGPRGGPYVTQLLQFWGGDNAGTDRVDPERDRAIKNRYLSIINLIQPSIWQKFNDVKFSIENGLHSRYLYFILPSVIPDAKQERTPKELIDRWGCFLKTVDRRPETSLTLSPTALDTMTNVFNYCVKNVQPETPEELFANKIVGHACRLAANIHILNNGFDTLEIQEDTMIAALRLIAISANGLHVVRSYTDMPHYGDMKRLYKNYKDKTFTKLMAMKNHDIKSDHFKVMMEFAIDNGMVFCDAKSGGYTWLTEPAYTKKENVVFTILKKLGKVK